MLDEHPELAGATIFTAAATGSVSDLDRFLAADPAAASAEGGPHQWPPLLYLCYSRLPDAPPDRSSLDCARLLLDAGADPNAGFLWEGLAPPFTALTGAFGGGEDRANQPPHQHAAALARLLLEAGADPNDGQTLYNRMFEASDEHLRLLFALRSRVAAPADRGGRAWASPAESGRDAGRPADLGRRAGPDGPGRPAARERRRPERRRAAATRPTRTGRRTSGRCHTGSKEMAALLAAAGARPPRSPIDAVDRFLAAALGGGRGGRPAGEPGRVGGRDPAPPGAVEQAVDLRRPEAVRLLVEAGFSVHGAAG